MLLLKMSRALPPRLGMPAALVQLIFAVLLLLFHVPLMSLAVLAILAILVTRAMLVVLVVLLLPASARRP